MASIKMFETLKAVAEREFDQAETLQWLSINKRSFFSWGSHKLSKYENTSLFFTVSGRLHKGIVLITLGWDDTYTVRLLSSQWNEKAKFEGIYCDMLNEFIDSKVEYIKAYGNN